MGARRLTIAAFLFVTATPALATVVSLDFNTVPLSGNAGNGLGATAGSSIIQTWVNNALWSAGYPTASATVTGALATATYNGESKVVGDTLGTSDGSVHHGTSPIDVFIINNDFGIGAPASHSFTIAFTGLKIYSLSFDWEIFPDITCALGTTCYTAGITNPNWPDIELMVNGGSTAVWSQKATKIAGQDPQGLGTSGPLSFAGGVNSLTFMDWPAEVGIDRLKFSTVPEPSPLALVGLALAVLALVRRWVQRGAGSTSTGSTAF